MSADKGVNLTEEQKRRVIDMVRRWYIAQNVGKVRVFDAAEASHGGNFFSRLFSGGYATIKVSPESARQHTPDTVFAGNFRDLIPR